MRVSADTAAFLLELGGFMATRDASNRPTAVESLVLEIDPESGIAEIASVVRYARNTIANLRDNGRFALVISRAWGDHRSVQIKGRCLDVSGPFRDAARIAPRNEVLAQVLGSFGVPPEVADNLRKLASDRYHRLRVQIEEVYDQTPGPGAGKRLA